VIFLTSPTLDWRSSHFSQVFFSLGFILSILAGMIFIWDISIERRFESFLSLVIILLLLILPIFLHGYSSLPFLIHVLSLPNGLSQSLGFIILNILFIKGWKSTQKPCVFTFSSFIKPTYFSSPKKLFSYSAMVMLRSLISNNSCILLS
jgi:hypothetical protein